MHKEKRKEGWEGGRKEGRDVWREGRKRKKEGRRKEEKTSVIPFGLFTLSLMLIHEHIEKKVGYFLLSASRRFKLCKLLSRELSSMLRPALKVQSVFFLCSLKLFKFLFILTLGGPAWEAPLLANTKLHYEHTKNHFHPKIIWCV